MNLTFDVENQNLSRTDKNKVIADSKVPLKGIEARMVNKNAVFMLTVELSNREQLEKLFTNIRKIQGVLEVIRISG